MDNQPIPPKLYSPEPINQPAIDERVFDDSLLAYSWMLPEKVPDMIYDVPFFELKSQIEKKIQELIPSTSIRS
jgi:hypothetical protein